MTKRSSNDLRTEGEDTAGGAMVDGQSGREAAEASPRKRARSGEQREAAARRDHANPMGEMPSSDVNGWKETKEESEEEDDELDEDEKLEETILQLSAYITVVASHLLSNS
ncbi:hypothetical protein GUITHDRAFT_117488 [Guillardia theta CCMP2712]|uniref:Uncharacterized protein n=2 Tax=Guillardia theta TaxID=55529 RepID=L1IKD9_GUITC|nr:hypothetical protein GUITHDRAFT_117488 [Guillardia theta CCMP2712]EKX36379.1 hypothetical protein GUITHDRAFT_117488 [Guillardia theta CCMP2712]|mmetsp:Transcript_23301/g.75754  ORF Transcript_23301/g.75754 Transcript_23301/m.75754 type:complete len:111 (+) Transcript_23301:227-559(+)|eukprot:XP_005823359.1 hypothetical protein GUITHDRAFT_117488 [Guillardia theta CCMP2712]